jgi:hypothetical protein
MQSSMNCSMDLIGCTMFKFKVLQWVGYILRMDNYRVLKDVLGEKFYGRRSVGRLRLR